MQGAARLIDVIAMMRMGNTGWNIAEREAKKLGSGLVQYTTFLNQFNDLGQAKIETEKWGLRNIDDFAKLNLEFKSIVQKNIPGFENNLRLKTDWLGDEVQKFGMLTDIEEHPVNKEARKINYKPTKVRKKMSVSVDILPTHSTTVFVELTEAEFAALSYGTGKQIKKNLNTLINSKAYKDQKVIAVKLALFDETVSDAKAEVKELFKETAMWSNIEKRAKKLAIKQIRSEQQGYKIQ
jgi:hypothetical protein